ncbi:MAG: pyridoxal-phosphate dependent enzyme, partial [Candidatus Margulisiibacteriota bacterium]
MDKKIVLSEKDLPQKWYNVMAEFPGELPPPLNPGTGKPLGPQDLAPIFPMSLIMQEMSPDRWTEIPDDIRNVLKIWRPTPLVRALELEKALKTNSRIYFKNESVSVAGSHKLNTAIAQVYYNKTEGVKRIATETGAGQWGSSLAFACG